MDEKRAGRQKKQSAARRGRRNYKYFDNDEYVIWEPKSKYSYINLKCGHVTTPESVELYHNYKGKEKGKLFCEVCGKWRKMVPKKPPTKYPDKPMF